MENKVLTIEQMQELIAMGVDTSIASMFWYNDGIRFKQLIPCSNQDTIDDWTDQYGEKCIIPTFTLQDILLILSNIKECIYTLDNTGMVIRDYDLDIIHNTNSNNPLKASFDMLKWCKQNNFI